MNLLLWFHSLSLLSPPAWDSPLPPVPSCSGQLLPAHPSDATVDAPVAVTPSEKACPHPQDSCRAPPQLPAPAPRRVCTGGCIWPPSVCSVRAGAGIVLLTGSPAPALLTTGVITEPILST